MGSYAYRTYPYRRPPELDDTGQRRPVVIVGAGMAGPTLALSLAARGVPSVILDEDDTVSLGSRSICQAKHSLEIWDRFGIAGRMVAKGITWEQGEVYLRDKPIYRFNLQPETGQKFPAFVNLQQYYVEGYLAERAPETENLQMRWKSNVIGLTQHDGYVDYQNPKLPSLTDQQSAYDAFNAANNAAAGAAGKPNPDTKPFQPIDRNSFVQAGPKYIAQDQSAARLSLLWKTTRDLEAIVAHHRFGERYS